jgi:hypothetical protein
VYSYVRLCGEQAYTKLKPVSGSMPRVPSMFFFYFLRVFNEELYDGNLFRISSSEYLMWSLLQWHKYLQSKYTSDKYTSCTSYSRGEDHSQKVITQCLSHRLVIFGKYFFLVLHPKSGLDSLIVEVYRSHIISYTHASIYTHTHSLTHTEWFLWTKN